MKRGTEKHDTSEDENSFSINGVDKFESNEAQAVLTEKKESIELFKIEEQTVGIQLEERNLDTDTQEPSIALSETETTNDQNTNSQKTSPRSELNKMTGIFVLWLLSGILGLFFLLLWFILAAFEAVGIWMLILGLGLLALFFILVIVFFARLIEQIK